MSDTTTEAKEHESFDVLRRYDSFFRAVMTAVPVKGFQEALDYFVARVPEAGLRALSDGELLIVRQNVKGGNAWLVEAHVPHPTFTRISELPVREGAVDGGE